MFVLQLVYRSHLGSWVGTAERYLHASEILYHAVRQTEHKRSIYGVKSNGPTTKPWGTQWSTIMGRLPFISWNWIVSHTYGINQANVILLISIIRSSPCKRMLCQMQTSSHTGPVSGAMRSLVTLTRAVSVLMWSESLLKQLICN